MLRTQNYTQIEGETRKLFRQIALADLKDTEPEGIGDDRPTLLAPGPATRTAMPGRW